MKTVNHECYVSLEVAKLLKEAGFDWECKKIHFKTEWKGNDDVWELEDNNKKTKRVLELDYCLLAPTLDVAQRWLREIKGLHILIYTHAPAKWEPVIMWIKDYTVVKIVPKCSYEEALEEGIKKCLTILLEEKK